MRLSAYSPRLRCVAAAAAAMVASCAVHAANGAVPAAASEPPVSPPSAAVTLPEVVVTGNPLRSTEVTLPTSALTGDALVLRRGSSLGETLDGLPGVSSTYFGPNASRPVIRGQDGDRIRMLSNAGASLDAAALSFDHAVPIDPLVVERVEVLRGPAALLYGGSAVGGVVNTIDNRIPRAPVKGPSGAAEVRLGGAAAERSVGALVETGGQGLAFHVDVFARRTEDLRVPEFDRPLDDGSTERRRRVVNSASDARGGAFGGSMVWDHGYLGASVDTYRNDYGVVAEEDVTIRMKRDRLAVAGEVRDLPGLVRSVRWQGSASDYRHEEVEGTGAVGTTFKHLGGDLRLEAAHAKQSLGAGALEGVWGLQGETARFQALGDEAFVPSTQTRQLAAFVLEQWRFEPAWQLSAGARAEQVRVRSSGDVDAAEARFGAAAERRFSPRSASFGLVRQWGPQWTLSANAAYTERAPTSYELYANGVHAATGTFERGDTAQRLERGRSVDLALQWKAGHDQWKVSLFDSRFSNYIALMRTGEPDAVNDEGDAFPVYAFEGVRARLRGAEVEGKTRLMQGAGSLDLEGHLDALRGDNLTAGEPLPRMAPLRGTVALAWQQAGWTSRVELQHAARQDRVPSDDVATPAWTILNLSLSYRLAAGPGDALLFVRLNNVGNALAYNAGTIASVRALSPLPGRALSAGLRYAF